MYEKVNLIHSAVRVSDAEKNICRVIVTGTDGRILSTAGVISLLAEAKKDGDIYMKGNLLCDDFDERTGCRGHVYEYFKCGVSTCVFHRKGDICSANCRDAATKKIIDDSRASCPYKLLTEKAEL